MRCMWLLRVPYARNIPIVHPTVICYHGLISQTPITRFHCSDVLVKPLTLLIANLSNVCKKKSKCEWRKCNFRDIWQPIFYMLSAIVLYHFCIGDHDYFLRSLNTPIENSTKLFFQFHLELPQSFLIVTVLEFVVHRKRFLSFSEKKF